MPAAPSPRLKILKTYKLFIGGKFPRPEGGRVLTATHPADRTHLAHYGRASAKDLRDAVASARLALPSLAAHSAYLRGQMLYRLAEMLESRAAAFAAELTSATGSPSTSEVNAAIDRLVYLAGWTDKLSQVFSSINPVAGPYFNVSSLDPVGVVVAFAPDRLPLLAAVTLIGNALAAANPVILIPSDPFPLPALSLAEAIATSDLPPGSVNILSGLRAELAPAAASHRDIDALVDATADPATAALLQVGRAVNLKRLSHFPPDLDWADHDQASSPYRLLDLTETRTTWHPVGA